MPHSKSALPLESFQTFGDLLKYLRRRARLTQREVAIAVGYSEAQISRLEQNVRPPELASVIALFVPALFIDDEPEIIARLMQLAAQARGEALPEQGVISFSSSTRQEVTETLEVAENIKNNLPISLTSFIGRRDETDAIKNLLGNHRTRLVVLTGTGGCGKTRLALHAAHTLLPKYRDGIWFIELALISDAKLILPAVASTLGIPESHDGHPINMLTKYLRTKQLLLILDNCEQIVNAVAQFAEDILQACPQVQILATSREILNIIGEVQFRVPALSLSSENSSGNATTFPSEAVQLFVERAQAVSPSFALTDSVIPAVTQICHLVDGLPLGIELAAAKITVLSIEQIATRLNSSLHILRAGRGSLPHHQTLEATIQWSYDLLSEAERVLMQRLSVFSGGWTLDSAEAVVSDPSLVSTEKVFDLISQLVNKSLIVVNWQPRTDAYYTMLQTIREFASEKLRATGERERIRSLHFDYFLSLAQEARLFGNEKGIWLDRLEADHDNLRSALSWSLETGEIEKGAELILPILDFYWVRGYSKEAREWMGKFLEIESPASQRRALLLQKAGWLTRASGDFGKADLLLLQALEMARQIGDKNRAALALMDLGLSVRDQGDNEQAVSYFSEALQLVQETGNKREIGNCLYYLAQSYSADLDRSMSLWEQGLTIHRDNGDKTHIAWGLEGLAGVAYLKSDFASALKFHSESLRIKVEVMDKLGIAYSLEGLAQVVAAANDLERAAVLWGAANRLREEINVPLEASREDMYTSRIPMTRSQLGDEVFDQAWNKGRAMNLMGAIAYGLG